MLPVESVVTDILANSISLLYTPYNRNIHTLLGLISVKWYGDVILKVTSLLPLCSQNL